MCTKHVVTDKEREKAFCMCLHPIKRVFSSSSQKDKCSMAVHSMKHKFLISIPFLKALGDFRTLKPFSPKPPQSSHIYSHLAPDTASDQIPSDYRTPPCPFSSLLPPMLVVTLLCLISLCWPHNLAHHMQLLIQLVSLAPPKLRTFQVHDISSLSLTQITSTKSQHPTVQYSCLSSQVTPQNPDSVQTILSLNGPLNSQDRERDNVPKKTNPKNTLDIWQPQPPIKKCVLVFLIMTQPQLSCFLKK